MAWRGLTNSIVRRSESLVIPYIIRAKVADFGMSKIHKKGVGQVNRI